MGNIIVSAGTGNWNTGATWTGGVAPTDGDTAVIGAHAITINCDIGTVLGGGIRNIHLGNASAVLQADNSAPRTIIFASTGTNPLSTATNATNLKPYGDGTGTGYLYDNTVCGIYIARGTLNLTGTASNPVTIKAADTQYPIYISHPNSCIATYNGSVWGTLSGAGTVTLKYCDITNLGTTVDGFYGLQITQNAASPVDVQNCTIHGCNYLLYSTGSLGSNAVISNNTITRWKNNLVFSSAAFPGLTFSYNTVSEPAITRAQTLSESHTLGGATVYYRADATTSQNVIYTTAAQTGWSVTHNNITGGPIPDGGYWSIKSNLMRCAGVVNLLIEYNTIVNYPSNNEDNSPGGRLLYLSTATNTTGLIIRHNSTTNCNADSIHLGCASSAVTIAGSDISYNYFEDDSTNLYGQGILFIASGINGLDLHHNVLTYATRGTHIAVFIFLYYSSSPPHGTQNHAHIFNNTFVMRDPVGRLPWYSGTLFATWALFAGDNGDPSLSTLYQMYTTGMQFYNNAAKNIDYTIADTNPDNMWDVVEPYKAGAFCNALDGTSSYVNYVGLSRWYTTYRGTSPTKISDTSFSVSSATNPDHYKNLTLDCYRVGKKVRLYDGTSYVYGTVTTPTTYSLPTTTVTLTMDTGQVVPSTITEIATATNVDNPVSANIHPHADYGDIETTISFADESGHTFDDFALVGESLLATGGYGSTYIGALDPIVDATAPTVTEFVIPATSASLTVDITTLTATDAVGVTGYLVNESATTPAVDDAGWSATKQTEYVFATDGSKTLYAWAKDAAGNISTSLSDTVLVDSTSPVVTFTLPATADSITIDIATLSATDAVGVTGYYLSESATTPAVDAAGWVATPPSTFDLNETQTRTVYAWAKDAAGNISEPVAASVDVTLTGAAAGDPMYVYHDGNWILVGTLVTYPPA